MIPLFAAAAIAYEQVFSTRRSEGGAPSVDELDLVALAPDATPRASATRS
jgi:hypothetical protein